jgi:tRNA pseudouridine13 synthase
MSEDVGLRAYLSKTPGIGGAIKEKPEDFLVEEITPEATILELGRSQLFESVEGDYIHFTLEKNNWDTMRAVKVISKACNVSQKRIKYAGTKDRRSISAQRMSIWQVPVERLEKLKIKDLALRDFCSSPEPVNLGSLSGNRFSILIRQVPENADERVKKIVEELGGKAPNFFGTQRFGLRMSNHLIGKHILKGDFKAAVMSYLCDTGNEPEEATKEREKLRESEDFGKALKSFPDYLGYEKSMLNRLALEPGDYIGAMRELPKKLRWMFVHAFQGYVFNLALSEYIESGSIPEKLPLVGSSSEPDEVSAGILDKEGIVLGNFRVKAMPEMSTEGLMRESLVPFGNFELLDFNREESKLWVRFSLPPGSYATVLLREIMK